MLLTKRGLKHWLSTSVDLNRYFSGNEPKSKESKVQANQSEEAKTEVPSPKKTTAITIPKSNVTTKSNSEPSALLSLGAQYR